MIIKTTKVLFWHHPTQIFTSKRMAVEDGMSWGQAYILAMYGALLLAKIISIIMLVVLQTILVLIYIVRMQWNSRLAISTLHLLTILMAFLKLIQITSLIRSPLLYLLVGLAHIRPCLIQILFGMLMVKALRLISVHCPELEITVLQSLFLWKPQVLMISLL